MNQLMKEKYDTRFFFFFFFFCESVQHLLLSIGIGNALYQTELEDNTRHTIQRCMIYA